jgi:hypothetical protein
MLVTAQKQWTCVNDPKVEELVQTQAERIKAAEVSAQTKITALAETVQAQNKEIQEMELQIQNLGAVGAEQQNHKGYMSIALTAVICLVIGGLAVCSLISSSWDPRLTFLSRQDNHTQE